ncbi:MAG: DUF1573 domain-containing protein [Muribaculaceae bacterium]|nr:DUF1573 domain-containing protein [Muribaculaceae bacterium]
MRFIISLIFAGALLTSAARQSVEWVSESHDFKAFKESEGKVSCSFLMVNTGDEPVAIVNARANCGCTTPQYQRTPVEPGDTAVVSVAYDPVGRPGRFKKKVVVQTTAEPSRSTLWISGVVIANPETVRERYPVEAGPLRLRQSMGTMGQIKRPHLKTVYIDVYNVSADSVMPEIKAKPEYMHVAFEPSVIPPGEQGSMLLYLYTDRCRTYGLVEDSVRYCVGVGEFVLPVTARILEDFSKLKPGEAQNPPVARLSPEVVDFNLFTAGEELHGTVMLKNTGKRRLEVRRVYSRDKGVTVTDSGAAALKPGKSCEITFSVSPEAVTDGVLNVTLDVITNDPSNPEQTVRIVGIAK